MRIPLFSGVAVSAVLVAAVACCALAAGDGQKKHNYDPPPGTPEGAVLRYLPDYDDLPALEKRGDASKGWKVHDFKRPLPPRVKVGELPSTPPPSDAIVLFDGTDQSIAANLTNTKWKAKDGGMVATGGNQKTIASFGDCQLHLEWRTLDAKCPGMCNSGVIFMDGRYEIQVMDSEPSRNVIPADGIAGAVYGWEPPAVNPIRDTKEWNTYDIVFRRPRFGEKGECTEKARVTMFFNGVLVHDGVEFPGPTEWHSRPPYRKHADKMPLVLQDHGGGVEYRNIWIRPME